MKNKAGNQASTTIKILDWVKFTIAGGIGGIAVYNTVMLVISASPDQSAESIAMGVGAVVAAAAVKVLHIV